MGDARLSEREVEAVARVLADTFGRHFAHPRKFDQMPKGAQDECRKDARTVLMAIAVLRTAADPYDKADATAYLEHPRPPTHPPTSVQPDPKESDR